MPYQLEVPKLGLTMSEGTVAEWCVEDGAEVSPGETVYILVTDKTETAVETEAAGTLVHAVVAGTVLKPGDVAGWVLANGEQAPALPTGSPADDASARPEQTASKSIATQRSGSSENKRIIASPNARRVASENGVGLETLAGTGPGGRIVSEDVEAALVSNRERSEASRLDTRSEREATVRITPLAAVLAERLMVNPSSLDGTGPGGSVRLADVLASVGQLPLADESPKEIRVGSDYEPGSQVPMTAMRRIIADRMSSSLQQMAQLTLTRDVYVDQLIELRASLKEQFAEPGFTVPSVTDLIVKAAAFALRRHPLLNSSLENDTILIHEHIDIGLAVSVEGGLVVPVVRSADDLPARILADVSRSLAQRARRGELEPDDLHGPTFTVTALGALGVDAFTPIVNPPNVAILGVGRIRDAVAWDDGRPVRRLVMSLSLTIDHRVVDGAPGAEFLSTIEEALSRPIALLA